MVLSCVTSTDDWIILQTPVQIIASNAGVEGAVIVGKLLEQDNTDLGYDAAKGKGSLLITLAVEDSC